MVSGDDVKKAMDVLGITDVHADFAYVKKVHKRLLVKWHPDSCPKGKTEEYTKRSAEINAAFDVLEKAYKIGMMGPGAKDFRETSNEKETNTNTNKGSFYSYTNNTKQGNTNTYRNNYQSQSTYNTYSYYEETKERERRAYEKMYNDFLIFNGICNFIFYAICIKHIYRSLTETDSVYRNMLIKETPYYLSVLLVVFYLLKRIYGKYALGSYESDLMGRFCKIYLPIAFVFPIIYTFMHGIEAAIVFSAYFAGWAIFEWLMDIKIYQSSERMGIKIIKGKKLSLPFIFFAAEEATVIAFGVYVAISAIYIK